MGRNFNDNLNLPLSVKLTRFMYYGKGNHWTGNSRELAQEVMIHAANGQELRSQISHAISLLKEEGILTAGSGFVNKDTILLELVLE